MPTTRKRKHVHTDSPEPQNDETEVNEEQNELSTELHIWESFREEYIETIDQLPLSLHRSFTLLRQFDAQSHEQMSKLLPATRQYIKYRESLKDTNNSSNISWTQKNAWLKLKDISTFGNEYLRAAEEKVNLAQSSYDSVDRHIRLLDQAIREQEQQLSHLNPTDTTAREQNDEMQNLQSRVKSNGVISKKDKSVPTVTSTPLGVIQVGPSPSLTTPGLSDVIPEQKADPHRSSPTNPGMKIVEKNHEISGDVSAAQPLVPEISRSLVRDMPFDPHEPRYCYCNGFSYGEMIACDGGCEREWFHLECVGLTSAPKGKGKWYCDVCKENFVAGARKKGH